MLLALAHCHAYDFFFYRLSKNISTNQQTKHRHGVVHRDIKLDNFIFDRRGVLKLIDFGLSKQWIQNGKVHSKMKIKKMNSVVGTLDTIAPEVMSSDIPYVQTRSSRKSLTHSPQLKTNQFTETCDMWSLGWPFSRCSLEGTRSEDQTRKIFRNRFVRERNY